MILSLIRFASTVSRISRAGCTLGRLFGNRSSQEPPSDSSPKIRRGRLHEKDGVTTVRLTHSGFASQASRDVHRGWPQIVEWLRNYVEKRYAGSVVRDNSATGLRNVRAINHYRANTRLKFSVVAEASTSGSSPLSSAILLAV